MNESAADYVRRLTRIGIALSAETDLDRLMEMIVDEARRIAGADGGTLYLVSDDRTELRFSVVQNHSLGMRLGGRGEQIPWPAVPLVKPDGSPNYANVCAYGALSGQVVSIADVYDVAGLDFEGMREFDARTGYRSRSMLVVPLRNHENEIIGVLQLLNAQDPLSGTVVPFSDESREITASLASQAAVALTKNRLIHDVEQLLESFIRSVATAIDEKSPYTGGHVRRVAELTTAIAERVDAVDEGPFSDVHFSADELKALRLAAWLHDLGKITTPEALVQKASKLQGFYDRIETVALRFELLKREAELSDLRDRLLHAQTGQGPAALSDWTREAQDLDDDLAFLGRVNAGAETMTEDDVRRVQTIAGRTVLVGGQARPLLTDDEMHNLSVRQGTLTQEEREVLNRHAALTFSMLSQLPFPRKLRDVPAHAAAHHEKLNGSGYPRGLGADQLSLPARIVALADVFEALTAKDRPYRQGMTIPAALRVLAEMADANHLDRDLLHLFAASDIPLAYAARESIPTTNP